MKVKLVAATTVHDDALESAGYKTHTHNSIASVNSADELAEFAGRNCYRSFDRPNPATAENRDYLANIINQGHESVLEHASATFYIEASRSVLTELNTHRHLSRSVVSQRYVDVTELGCHVPPAINELPDHLKSLAFIYLDDAEDQAHQSYQALVSILAEAGMPRKKAREAARAVLPNMTNSPMVVTGNHRAWRDFLRKRWHVAADAEIRELAGLLLSELRTVAPNTYQDFPDTPFS
ncbi:FAD-dependent thymidylate synthase [Nocardia farcinica]|uniref:FAD-dependent thymidylate synthase n=1 Tax=Nocardia farcinica TaxID=37329 RepID=UPI000DFDA362|nr:FAD-dependent thymidylate synthase [Nocardia farcinica]SUE29567.1 FAD-dependent thymidylate synthase [Nocardia farcinica]